MSVLVRWFYHFLTKLFKVVCIVPNVPCRSMERATLGHKQVVESYKAVLDQEQGRPQTATSLTYQLTINTKWNKQYFKLELSDKN